MFGGIREGIKQEPGEDARAEEVLREAGEQDEEEDQGASEQREQSAGQPQNT